ncbi:MAG: 50S ribosomal protein L19 [bacterium]
MDIIRDIEEQIKPHDVDFDFCIGDTVRVEFKIIEGGKERIQPFEGICISKHGSGLRSMFTLRKISSSIGVEKTFPLYSPRIQSLKVITRGRTRRAKLYYLRHKVGKQAVVKEAKYHPKKKDVESDS